MLRVRSRILKQHKQKAPASQPINKKNKLSVVELFPYDLIVEILSWLPSKFAVRCKIVCKLWQSIIQNRHFIDKHFQRQKAIIIYVPRTIIYIPPYLLPDVPPDEQLFQQLYYLRGLFLEQNTVNNGTYRIRNFTTNQVFELPDIKEHRISASLCYLPTNDEYKVMHLHWKEDNTNIGLKVLTIGTDFTWRSVEVPLLLSCSKSSDDERVFSLTPGNVSYIMKLSKFSNTESKMVVFQIEDESFVEISLPWRVKFCGTGLRCRPLFWDLNPSIGCMVGEELRIWVLQDYKTSMWDERKIVFPSDLIKRHPYIVELTPRNVIMDSEILVLYSPNPNDLKQVNYNIKTKVASSEDKGHMLKPSLVSL